MRLHRSSSDEAAVPADDGVGDRVTELAAKEFVLAAGHRLCR
jgi:hypothetical protein